MKIGILGATGAVGRQMIECLEERNIAVMNCACWPAAAVPERPWNSRVRRTAIQEAKDVLPLPGLDIVLGAVEADIRKRICTVYSERRSSLY